MTQNLPPPPLEKFFELNTLSDAGAEVRIAPDAVQLERLAQWFEIPAVQKFEAIIKLKRVTQTRFLYDAHLMADIVQSCVVTLVPLPAHIDRRFQRALHLMRQSPAAAHGGEIVVAVEEDEPEEIESSRFDLVAPLLEELALAMDPYPRAPGVAFDPPESETRPESPFAVLGRLKS